ncbi:MAG: gamma-glutamyltransferase [Dongiaceae bacterium]
MDNPEPGRKRRLGLRYSRLALAALATLNLTACYTGPVHYAGDLYTVADFYGGVIADEPRAALIGRDILASGGNAADAMVAMYFAMSVTMPSSAAIGGGGVCIAHKIGEKKAVTTNVIDFLPRAAAGGKVAVPGNVRGMAALWAAFGQMQWAELVSPGENLAVAGTPVSRALAKDIAAAGQVMRADPQMAGYFVQPDGQLLNESDNLRQIQLGTVLGQVRAQGASAFYSGPLAQRLSDAAQAIGAPLTMDDLRNFKVNMYAPLEIPYGDQTVYLPQPPAAGGVSTAQMLTILENEPDKTARRTHFLAEASMRVMADRSNWMKTGGEASGDVANLTSSEHTDQLMASYQGSHATAASALTPPAQQRPENPWAASAIAVDLNGTAVACNFTMNALFGAGRIAGDTGVILAPAPDDQGAGFSALSPMILANSHNGEFYYGSVATGGMPGALSEAMILHDVLNGEETLDKALLEPRVYHNGVPDKVFYESGADSSALTALGHQVEEQNGLGIINAIYCPGGAPTRPDSCVMRNDYRGNGLSSFYSKH